MIKQIFICTLLFCFIDIQAVGNGHYWTLPPFFEYSARNPFTGNVVRGFAAMKITGRLHCSSQKTPKARIPFEKKRCTLPEGKPWQPKKDVNNYD